jgi:hypothetical protein
MNKVLITLTALGLMGVTAATVSAHGIGLAGERLNHAEQPSQQEVLQYKAEVLGISVEDYKTACEDGKTFRELATELGVSREDMHARKLILAHEKLQAQVNAGEITQVEADEMLERIEERPYKRGMHKHTGKRCPYAATSDTKE